MKICIAGKNNIAVRALEYLITKNYFNKENILVCPNDTDNGIDSWQLSLKKYAEKNKLKIVELNNLYDIKDLIFISLEYNKIIKPDLFCSSKLFNIHFSLLPKYKGMYTSVWPILNGEKYTGVTLHIIDSGIDTGDIIAQYKFPIEINDTARDLYFKYLDYGYKLFVSNIKSLINNDYTLKPQGCYNSSYYSKGSINFKDIKIDLNKTSFEIHNQIRAFIFPEYQLPTIKNFKILKTELTCEKIDKNHFEIKDNILIISGIDGYKIILHIL